MEARARRDGRAEPHGGRALRPLPRLHGVRHLVPVGRAVRPADRVDARARSRRSTPRRSASALLRGLLFRVFPHPRRLRAALRLAPVGRAVPLPRRFRAARASSRRRGAAAATSPAVTPAQGRAGRARRAAHGLRPERRLRRRERATARVLAADGYEVVAPPSGLLRRARAARRPARGGQSARARAASTRSRASTSIVTNAAGLRLAPEGLGWLSGTIAAAAFAAKVRDVAELLAARPRARRHPLPLRVALQDSCHLAPRAAVPRSSRAMLGAHPGARGRRAGRAGDLLRQRRDLQPRPARRRPRARRPQGGERARDRAGASTRARTPAAWSR